VDHFAPPPRGGHYSCSLVSFCVDLFLQTGASPWGTAAAFAVFVRPFHLDWPVPSFPTIRAWVWRLGCYALLRPMPQDVPWLWIIDHTIHLGAQKLFLVVGCPLADVPFGQRCLALADLQVVALAPNGIPAVVGNGCEATQARRASEGAACPLAGASGLCRTPNFTRNPCFAIGC